MLNKILSAAGRAPRATVANARSTEPTLAERRARALAPTIYCPSARVEQCLDLPTKGHAQ